jgi:hypothetical protein
MEDDGREGMEGVFGHNSALELVGVFLQFCM